jgi:hypothetical protein
MPIGTNVSNDGSKPTSIWKEVDGVRTPMMVCPNKQSYVNMGACTNPPSYTLKKSLLVKKKINNAFRRKFNRPLLLQVHRAVLTCNVTHETFGAPVMPRVIQVNAACCYVASVLVLRSASSE